MNRVLLLLTVTMLLAGNAPAADPLFPFVLPWDDASPGATDFSALSESPAARHGRVRAGEDGHFYTGNRRIRFFGVNFTNAACFPDRGDAEKIAARLAKFGMNVVRFHFIDSDWGKRSIWKRGAAGELDPENLDRLGWFVAQLKARGIYSNLNLLVGRQFAQAPGLPPEIAKLEWKESHIPGFFNAAHLGLQQDYARRLLSYRNPHTGLSFAEDPAVAFVEILNEHGLVHSWLGGKVEELPAVFREELRGQWNNWLKQRHGSTDALKAAWQAKEQPLGNEMLRNASFGAGVEGWTLELHAGARAMAATSGDALRLEVVEPGTEDWHVQFNQQPLKLAAGQPYTFRFRARAAKPLSIRIAVERAHDPWDDIGMSSALALGPDWKECNFVFVAKDSDDRVRAGFSRLGGSGSVVELAGLSLRPGGIFGLRSGETIESGSMPLFEHQTAGERTLGAQRDWVRFLCDTEDRYWATMTRCLKEELGVKGLVTGTIAGCAPVNSMAGMDWVDTHAYWQHPRWPHRQWDAEDWFVENRPMVNEPGGVLAGLAAKRVAGKPHACTEYNHPAPNTYSSEMFPLLAAYAALQDWDAIYGYTYSHGQADGWDQRKITGFFDLDQHPAKMANAGAAAALFRRADVRPAAQAVLVPFDREREIDLLRTARAWSLADAVSVGLPREAALLHRVALLAGGSKSPAGALAPGDVKIDGRSFASDTGELLWDLRADKRGVVTINSPLSKAVIGFGGGKRFVLGDAVVEPGPSRQDGFAVITLTACAGGSAGGAPGERWLLTATGDVENTGMGWKNPEKSSVGRAWGLAPSLVEGVPARIAMARARSLQVWALDERGQRRQAVPVQQGPDGATFEIGPQWKTAWYEAVCGE